jgi:hypothetical protein
MPIRNGHVRIVLPYIALAICAEVTACDRQCILDEAHAPSLTATIQVPGHALDAFDIG